MCWLIVAVLSCLITRLIFAIARHDLLFYDNCLPDENSQNQHAKYITHTLRWIRQVDEYQGDPYWQTLLWWTWATRLAELPSWKLWTIQMIVNRRLFEYPSPRKVNGIHWQLHNELPATYHTLQQTDESRRPWHPTPDGIVAFIIISFHEGIVNEIEAYRILSIKCIFSILPCVNSPIGVILKTLRHRMQRPRYMVNSVKVRPVSDR
jgi:hypothetical protein